MRKARETRKFERRWALLSAWEALVTIQSACRLDDLSPYDFGEHEHVFTCHLLKNVVANKSLMYIHKPATVCFVCLPESTPPRQRGAMTSCTFFVASPIFQVCVARLDRHSFWGPWSIFSMHLRLQTRCSSQMVLSCCVFLSESRGRHSRDAGQVERHSEWLITTSGHWESTC